MKVDAYQFWQRFDELRDGRDMQSLLEGTGIKYKTLLAMRCNQSIPKSVELYQLSRSLGVSMEYLLTGEVSARFCLSSRILAIAKACESATELDLMMVEKILDIPPAGKNTDVREASS